MAYRIIGLERLVENNSTLLTGALGCFDTLGDASFDLDRDETLHERSSYELVREQLTADQIAELEQIDVHWRANAAAFNADFAVFHFQEDKEAALRGFVQDERGDTPAIPRGHWWWRPIDLDAG